MAEATLIPWKSTIPMASKNKRAVSSTSNTFPIIHKFTLKNDMQKIVTFSVNGMFLIGSSGIS